MMNEVVVSTKAELNKITPKKFSVFGIQYAATNYDEATHVIIENGLVRNSFGVSALAVHGLITSYWDTRLKDMVNSIDLVVPDGQPVKWALNSFHHVGLTDRVYGPQLTLCVLEEANRKTMSVYLYGSTATTCERFVRFISSRYPGVRIAGVHVDRFREATEEEDLEDIRKINESGAQIVLVGRGCPRQEVWVANHLGKVNAVMMAVGAAFDFHAGTVPQAPRWMQRFGLEWLFRLMQEPRRLWKRYLTTNSFFIYLFLKHKILLRKP